VHAESWHARRVLRWIVSLALSAACSWPGSSGAPVVEGSAGKSAAPTDDRDAATVKKRTLEEDETLTTTSGATFTASAGWSVEERPEAITLTAPEGDLRLSFVEVAEPDRDEAIAAAWKRVAPRFALKLADAVDLPARDGWDAHSEIVYVTPAAEHRVVLAVARRKGPTWFIALVDGKQAAVDRRGAQGLNAISSLKVNGIEKESVAGKTAHSLDAARISELDRFIEEARTMANVPGAAVVVVQDDVVVLAKGYGVKKLGTKGKVGPRTLFEIGSVTKPLTALMMARLVDEGTFTWDTPVTALLPGFALGDPATTERLQVRHTVCACTGMPRQDAEFAFEGLSAEQRLASMKSMMPTTQFGETFQYSNLMVMAGGYAAAHARSPKRKLLPAYTEAMQALVFAPLGMKSTTLDFDRVARSDHATPHARDRYGQTIAMAVEVDRYDIGTAPAGSVWSTADDMARFVALELGNGKLGGKQLVSEQQILARRVPQVKITDEMSYGLAWGITNESGLNAVGHNGGTEGFSSLLRILPEHGVGIVILANARDGDAFLSAAYRRVVELLFDAEAKAKEDLAMQIQRDAKALAEERELLSEADPAWFDNLAGAWEAPGLGRIDLARDNRGATLDAGEWKVTVGKRTGRDGTVTLVATGVPLGDLELVPRDRDGRTVLVLSLGQHEYVFERAR
jgi:CubicO group peptidase (beta-lactamase class C family)